MSDSHRHEREPDQAALDELMRAFADEPSAELEEIVIVEQSPVDVDESVIRVDEPDVVDHEPTPESLGDGAERPRIIRIDDVDAADVDHEPTPESLGDGVERPRIIRIDDVDAAGGLADDLAPGDGVADVAPVEPDVIEITDEDLPDAVYIEGSLERDGSGTIVFIEDDDTGDALAPDDERDMRRGIEPRLRERRVAVKRAQSRKRLKWVGLVAAIVLVGVAALAVLGSSLFAIQADQVTVTGNVYADPERLQAVVDDLVGTPALLADSQGAERELEAIPWVDEARVRIDFPHAATIEIRERVAWTTYAGPDGRYRVLDREGRVLDVLEGYPIAYVLVGGPDPADLEPGEFAPFGYAAASELAMNLTGSVRDQVEIIEVAADGSRLVMRLTDGTEVRFGEARDFFAKLVRLETVLTSGEEREPGVIDVSTSEVTS